MTSQPIDPTTPPVQVPILVVGAGPVGLALAGDLGWRGVSCLLVERSDGTITQPRMDGVGVRTMEFCRRWGITDRVEAAPYPRDHEQDNVYVTSMAGYELEREPIPAPGRDPGPAVSPERRERCPQDMFDPILARFVRGLAPVRTEYRTELVGVQEHRDHVQAELRGPDGRVRSVVAEFVVGCDGAGSVVRRAAGIPMDDDSVLTYSTNVIFRCPDLEAAHGKPQGYRFICIGPEGTYATVVAINGRDRWRLSIIGDGERREIGADDVAATIRRAVGANVEVEVLSTVSWARREAVADRYGTHRVLLAGDSAHVMSPTGGFGMNTGIGDAVDLAWKLDAVLAGWGGAELLASYETERRPVAVRNAAESSENLRRLLAPRARRPQAAVFEAGPAGDRARADYGAWFKDLVRREWFSLGVHLGYEYNDSPICFGDPDRRMSEDITRYEPSSRPGTRAPHVWLEDGRSTLDLFGRGFVLLRIGPDTPDGAGIAAAAARAGVPLHQVGLHEPAVIELYGKGLVLVRPDGFVAWRAADEPVDPQDVVDTVRGAVPSVVPA